MSFHVMIGSPPSADTPDCPETDVRLYGHVRFYELMMELQPQIKNFSGAIGFGVDGRMIEHVAAGLDLDAEPEDASDPTPFLPDLAVLHLAGDAYHDRATLKPLYRQIIKTLREACAKHGKLICLVLPSNLPDRGATT